ncbi:carbohydrate sulfotransferase 11-like [Palaemon carinicauda]|uniref:carbohydrate sulfotransferase 11-like n=1 Tax=Palaemon carinicauda TaxID=392227 RepID=UPI0035B6A557
MVFKSAFEIIARKWKLLFVMCGFATLFYIHSSEHKLLHEYRRNMQRQIEYIFEGSRQASDIASKNINKDSILEKTSSLTNETLDLPSPFVRKDIEVIFPSANNCSKKKYNLMLENHKGPTVPTRDVYPCKKWNYPDPNDKWWPIALRPSNGEVLNKISLSRVQTKVRDLVEEQLEVQRDRLATLKDTCDKYPELGTRQHVTFVWDTKIDPPVLYCPLYKVASTTWMVYFLRLAHVNDDNPALEIYKHSGQEKKKYMPRFGGGHQRVFKEFKAPTTSMGKYNIFKKSLRFIVVRHPFSRLLSAYRDKMERPKPRPFTPYFKDLQKAIIMKYRPEGSNITSPNPTFSEFVDYIIDSTEHLKTAKDWKENVVCWSTFWAECGVCSSDYQVVIKLETMNDDEQFLAHIANLKEIQNVQEWRNLKRAGVSSTVLLPKYYGSLTREQIYKLYERYKIDFELFGYTVDDYLKA